jgi:hypothetical protein
VRVLNDELIYMGSTYSPVQYTYPCSYVNVQCYEYHCVLMYYNFTNTQSSVIEPWTSMNRTHILQVYMLSFSINFQRCKIEG